MFKTILDFFYYFFADFSFSGFFITEICSSLFTVVKNKIKEKSFYLTTLNATNINTVNKDFKEIIKETFRATGKKVKIPFYRKRELKKIIIENVDILFDWLNKEPYPFFDEKQFICSTNIKKEIIEFLRELHCQIKYKRDSYQSFATNQLKCLENTNTDRVIDKLDIIQNTINGIKNINEAGPIHKSWIISSQLNKVDSLLKERKYKSAETILDSISDLVPDLLIEEKERYYELYTNIYFADQNNQANAIPYLEKLINHTSDSTKKEQRKILLLCLKKEYEQALLLIDRQLKEASSNRDILLGFKINILLLEGKTEEANIFIETIKGKFTKYNYWKPQILAFLGKYAKAEEFIRTNNILGDNNFDLKVLNIQVVSFKYTTQYHYQGLNIAWTDDINETIKEGESLIKEVGDNIHHKETLLVSLAFLYKLLNANNKVLELYMQLASMDSHEPNFLRNYPLSLLQFNKEKEAIIWFRKYFAFYQNDIPIQELYFQCLIKVDVRQAIDELEIIPISDKTIRIKSKLVVAYIKNFEIKKAEMLFKQLDDQYPNNPYILMTKAEYLLNKNKKVDARNLFKEIFEKVSDELDKIILLNRILFLDINSKFVNNYQEDVALLDTLPNDYEMLASFGEQYVFLLVYNGNLQKANATIIKIRKYKLLTPNILRNEILCYFNSQNYKKVLSLLEELQTYENLSPADNLLFLRACFALGDTQTFKEKSDSITEPETEQDYIILHQQLYRLGLRDKDIEFAHKGYKKFPQSTVLKENFFDSILGGSFNSLSEEIQKDAIKCRDEYFKTDAPEKRYKMIRIPQNSSPGDILEALNAAIPSREAINYKEIIDSNKCHISLITLRGYNYFDIWQSARYIDDFPIFYNIGDGKTLLYENEIAKAEEVVIDLPTLVTTASLEIIEMLPKIYKKIIISQQTIQEIENILLTENNLLLSNSYHCYFSLNNQKQPTHSIPWEEVFVLAKKIKRFTMNNCVEIVGRQLAPVNQLPSHLVKLFEKANFIEYESIRYSYETHIPIALENCYYRVLLQKDKNAAGSFCIDSILNRLVVEKVVSGAMFIKCLCTLLKYNYQFVNINWYSCFYALDYHNYEESDEINIFMNALANKEIYNSNWTISQLSILMVAIWNKDISVEKKVLWSEKIFEVYSNRGDVLNNVFFAWLKGVYKEIKDDSQKEKFKQFLKNKGIIS